MNIEDALRFLDYQAQVCRDRNSHEALCLLLPSLLSVFNLQPMIGREAEAFRKEFKDQLTKKNCAELHARR